MTEVRIVYNPANSRCRLFYDNREILSAENKIYAFLTTENIHDILIPFNRRYTIWQGLLPEIICEFNDDELNITFEGREDDFRALEEAFEKTESIVENIGYTNRWSLTFVKNFEQEAATERVLFIAQEIREMCETRAELYEIKDLVESVSVKELTEICESLQDIIEAHKEKWNQSSERHKKSKVDFLNIKAEQLKELLGYVCDA